MRVYRTANDLKIASAVADLKAFAFDRLPPILQEQANNYDDIVRQVAQELRDLAGPHDGIAFLLDCIDRQPDWMRYNNQNVWNQYSYYLGDWRHHAKELGDLEPRLLKYVLTELRRDLRSREQGSRTMYDRRHNYYWVEKAEEFAKVAEEVYTDRRASGTSVEYIAEYLFFGVAHEKRSIEILFAAHNEKMLSESGQWQLVDYLHRTQRYTESIPLLLPMVERTPGYMHYRTKLMHAYFRTGKTPELLALLKQTDAYFHEKDRWNEGAMAALGRSCLDNKLFAQSVAYYEELLPLYQRSHPRRSVGDGALHQYYTEASDAYAGLGKTKEAVDMASAAIVAWPARHDMRKQTLDHLVEILKNAPKIEEYIAFLDTEKMQSAIVRKAIGQALMKKNEHARAIPQLKLAAELQPNDAEIYQALIACFDKIGDKEGAVRQLLEAVELSRREIKLFEQLGTRLADLQRKGEAERAFTSTVEMLPNETESHTMLAEIYQKQNRYPEAIYQWERVVQIRLLEPTGLLKLATAQIHEKQWVNAKETLRKLRSQSWPARFNDVQQQARELEKQLEDQSKK
jgi:tetratricopeptide (TPR) repeat protein